MPLGTLTVYEDDGTSTLDTFSFYNAMFPEHGFPLLDPVHQLDPINAMGVNFTRHRIIREDVDPFPAIFHGDIDNWNNAVTAARAVRKFKGHLCTLTYTAGGVTFTLVEKLVIVTAVGTPMAGHVVTPVAAYPNNAAIVVAAFTLRYSGIDLAP